MRMEVRLFSALAALGTLTDCHAYDEELLTGRASAPGGLAANPASGAAADGGASTATPSAGGRAADAVDLEPSEGFGETDKPGDVTVGGTGGPAANSGDGASAAANAGSAADPSATGATGAAGATDHGEGSAGMSAANDAGPSAGKGSAAGSGEAGMNQGTTTAGTGGTAGSAGAPPDPATACTLRGGRVWEANQHCYFPLDSAESWNVSRDGCANLAATLVVITSDEEQAFVATLVGATARWIGLSRFGRPDFTWISGDAVDYTHWEDAGSAVSGDAAAIIRSDTLQWSVETLAAAHGALCERI